MTPPSITPVFDSLSTTVHVKGIPHVGTRVVQYNNGDAILLGLPGYAGSPPPRLTKTELAVGPDGYSVVGLNASGQPETWSMDPPPQRPKGGCGCGS